MARCVAVTGLFLFSLLTPAVWTSVENLQKIINYLHTMYGSGGQFALAINVKKCSKDVNLDQNFLQDEDPEKVEEAMNGNEKVYVGKQLIGAKPKPIPNKDGNYHSEYLLLIKSNPPSKSPDDPLMKKLLNKDKSGCVVFSTVNSPCVRSCSSPSGLYSIIPALDMFKSHNGPKAFVFRQVWHHDENSAQWEKSIREINSKVPLYRCGNDGCTPCVDNKVVHKRCKQN